MDELLSEIEVEAKRESWLVQCTRVILNFLNALILMAYAYLFDKRLELSKEWGADPFWFLIIGLGLAFLVFSFFVLYQIPNAIGVYFKAREVARKKESATKTAQHYYQQLQYYGIFAEACSHWQNFQNAIVHKGLRPSRRELATVLFSLIIEAREDLFEFERKEHWNFVLYLPDGKGLLQPVWREMSSRHPARRTKKDGEVEGRAWKVGVGHTGKAFFEKRTIITKDSNHEEVRSLMALPSDVPANDYDETAYRSYASIPILLDETDGATDEPIGVVLATSDRKDRFNKANCQILKQLAKVLFNILSFLEKEAKAQENKPKALEENNQSNIGE